MGFSVSFYYKGRIFFSQNVKAVLYDGSYHDVDSNEVSFKIAASLAFKKGIVEAKPCLLEPIMHMEIFVSDDYRDGENLMCTSPY